MDYSSQKKILLVEDEAIIALNQKKSLEEYGYTVVTAQSGEEAFQFFKINSDIDLVLMDVDLGEGIDGTEAAKKILSERDVPVVFLSSHIEPEIVKKTEKITSYGYVVKDSGITVLDASIKMAFKLFDANDCFAHFDGYKKREELLADSSNMGDHFVEQCDCENRYRLLLDLAVDGIMHGSHEGIITDVNECFSTITGLGYEDLIGKHIDVVPFTKESIKEKPLRFDLLRKGEVVVSQRNILRPDGSEVSVEMRTKMMPDGSYQSIYRDITENKRIEQQITALLAEKELLLKEVHHRIKNNMNTIISLISLQWRSLKDDSAKAALEDTRNRVRSMMVLYDKLYKSLLFKEISVRSYLPSLINEIIVNFPDNEKITVEYSIDDFILSAKILSPLGIIINEMLTNAMKHAFNDMDQGIIRVTASYDGKKAVFTVEDNGIGIYANPGYDDSECFGLELVSMLVKQINGSFRLENKNGTVFTLEFDE